MNVHRAVKDNVAAEIAETEAEIAKCFTRWRALQHRLTRLKGYELLASADPDEPEVPEVPT